MEAMAYGYARVLDPNQDMSDQLAILYEQGVEQDRVFVDEYEHKDKSRPQFDKLVCSLRKGDVLFVPSLGCLGSSSPEIVDAWQKVTKAKQASIVVLDLPLLDTRTTPYNMTGKVVEDVVLQLLQSVCEIEQTQRARRQAEGIARAKTKGVHCGRAPLPKPDNFDEVLRNLRNGDITRREAATRLCVSLSTADKWFRESETLK